MENADKEFNALEKMVHEIKESGEATWKTYLAAVELVDNLLRKKISIRLQARVRPSDLAQSALRSWMSDLSHGRIEPDSEIAYFYVLLGNKLNQAIRWWTTRKRSVEKEVPAETAELVVDRQMDSSELSARAVEIVDWVQNALNGEPEQVVTAFLIRCTDGTRSEDLLEFLRENEMPMSLRTLQLWFQRFRKLLEAKAVEDKQSEEP